MNRLVFVFLVVGIAFALAGCTKPIVVSCPTVKEYGPGFVNEFSAQYETLVPVGTALDTFIIDAVSLRKEARACRQEP